MLSCPYQPITCFLLCMKSSSKNVLSLSAKRMMVVWELVIAQKLITCLIYLVLLCSTTDCKCCLWNQTWIYCNGVKIWKWLCLYFESIPFSLVFYWFVSHYGDVTMSAMASLVTSVSTVSSIVCPWAVQRKHQSSASLALVREFTGDWWIPRTEGQ